MQLKSSFKSKSTSHLYEFSEETDSFGDAAEKNPRREPEENANTGSNTWGRV